MKILTFDLEDWFHVLDNKSTELASSWNNFESRLEKGLETILNILAKKNVKATFFCLGWVATKYPLLIKRIVDANHDIGSHSFNHQLVYNQTPEEFRDDLQRSISTIEDVSGKNVIAYRAPGFSLTKETPWAFDVLAESGITIDCSIFPANRRHGGYPEFGIAQPTIIKRPFYIIREFPINVYKIGTLNVVFSGGGYFRLLPFSWIKYFSNRCPYMMTYFHPRDFDKNQPNIPGLNRFRRFRSYVGISKSKIKLEKLIDSYKFLDLRMAANEVFWDRVPVVEI